MASKFERGGWATKKITFFAASLSGPAFNPPPPSLLVVRPKTFFCVFLESIGMSEDL